MREIMWDLINYWGTLMSSHVTQLSNNSFMNVQLNVSQGSIHIGKILMSLCCKTFHGCSIHCHFLHIITVYLIWNMSISVPRSVSWPWLRAVYVHHPDGCSDWPRLCQATLPSTHGALGNWLLLTQNTPHMGRGGDEQMLLSDYVTCQQQLNIK